jgi:hypothetical protein
MPRRTVPILASSVVALLLAACSASTGSASSAPAATQPAATAAPSAVASAGGAATTKVSANTASEADIAAALTAAGVPNADRWAREVTEYRPYPTDDPTLARLQDNLAKYQPDAATLQGILSALEP